jgi:hypothetical protein
MCQSCHLGVLDLAELSKQTYLLDGGVAISQQQVNSGLPESLQALNGEVLFVLLGVKDALLGLQAVTCMHASHGA